MKSASKKRVARHSPYPQRSRGKLYQYSSIDKGASEIRLMTLLPGAFGAKVRITIRNIRLSKSLRPVYEALSYTWGSAIDSDYVYVQDDKEEKALAITPNLAEALRYLRYEDRPRVLWIDAICVDQNNTTERGHQVLRMADIYRHATRVIIWLGPERDDSTLAMQELNALGQTIEVDWAIPEVRPLSGDHYNHWLEEPLPFAEDRKILAAIDRFLDRSWFKRLWIWQEVRLADVSTLMMCGGESMSWHTFRNAILCVSDKPVPPLQIERLYNFCDYNQLPSPLRDLLYATRYAQCSDERDRVYAILSLTNDFSRFEPDYSKTTEDVFKSVVIAYSMKKDLTVLSHCEMRDNWESRVPSWVPDWTTPKECALIDHGRASAGTHAQARCDKENVLVVSGCLLDVIEQISPLISRSSPEQLRKIVRNIMRCKAENDTCAASDSMVDSVCRTLCCNRFAEGFLPPMSYLPDTQESKNYVRDLMDSREPEKYDKYTNEGLVSLEGRASFQTRNGHIGLGPQSIRAGDQACIILGCRVLLLLRPNDAQTYKVVGECYIDGFMEGEALLGALPTDWQRVNRYFPDLGGYWDAFVNVQSGVIKVEDPRLGPLPAGWRIADHEEKYAYNLFSNEELGITETETDPRLSPEALRARGVKLQEIRLV